MAILIDHIQNVIQSDGVPNLILGLSGTVVTINGDPISTSTFNTSTLVLQAVSAGYATTASLASYATTASLATYATTATIASYATTASLASYATTASIASTATSAATAYTLANTSTFQVGFAGSAYSATTATSAATAYSLANTSTTQVGFAVNAFTATNAFFASTATNAGFAYSFNTATLVASAVTAQTLASSSSFTVGYSNTATNIAGGTAGMIHMQSTTGTTSFINAGTAGQLLQSAGSTASFVSTTTLQVGFAVNASTSTNAAVAYSLASTSTTQVGFAVSAFTATSAAIAYAVASTATLQVGSALFAVTATNAAVAYSLASTSTTQVGFAVSAFTATSAATAYSWTGGTVPNAVTFNGQVTFSGSATFVNSTATLYTDNILEIHTPPGGMDAMWGLDDGKDIGFHMHYFKNGTDTNAALLLRNDSKYLEWFQAGDDSTSNGNSFTATTYGTFKTGSIILANTTGTSSPTTGAFTVAGGVGVGGNIYVSGVVTATTFIGNLTGTASTATSAAVAYSLASTSTTQVGFAVSAFTATSAAIAYSVASTATLQVGSALFAVTATSAAIAYSLVNTSTFQSGFAVNAFTATSAATAYSWTGGTVPNASTFSSLVTANGGLSLGSSPTYPLLIQGSQSSNIIINANMTMAFTGTAAYFFSAQHGLTPTTATVNTYYGMLFLPTLNNTSTYTQMYGNFSRLDAGASATTGSAVTTWVGFSSQNPFRNTGAQTTLTTHKGFEALDVTGMTATNVRGIDLGIVVGSNRFNVYAQGSASNYFNGSVGIGTAGPNAKLDVVGSARFSGTATITDVTTSTSTGTGALVVAGGVGVGGSIYAASTSYIAGAQIITTATIGSFAVTSSGYATTSSLSAYATTSSLAAYATTASSASYATTSSLASYATTASSASYATTASSASYATTSSIASTATSAAVAYSIVNTSTLQVGFAVSAFTATSAAIAYSLVNTSTAQVGFAVSAFTATSAALAYAVASTSTLQVGSALFAVTATSAAIAYSLASTSTTQVGFAVSAFTATSAATAYSLVNTSTAQVGFAVSAFTATSAATAYNLANTTTFLVGNALTSVNATNATNIAGGTAGMIHIQSAPGVTSFINTGTVGYVLQMQTGNTATWVSTSSLGISGGTGGGTTFTGGIVPNVTTVTNYFTVFSSTSVTTRGVQEISGNADGSFLAPNNSGVMLHITGQSGQPGRLYIDGQGTSNYAAVIGRKSRGTTAAPTQVAADDIVFRLGSTPYTDAAFPAISTTRLDFLADELQTVTTQGSRIEAWVTQLGTTSSAISKQLTIATSGTVIWNTFTSISTTTGALQVRGGVGIGGNAYVGGDLYTRGVQVLPTNIQEFTATASQTIFTVAGGYTTGTVVVVANGIELGNADITATNGTTVTLATARNAGDIIRIKSGPASSASTNASLQAFSIAMSVALG